ncbi:integrase, catalytic region, zinc finger, CCHC-type containing protein [Tanacetum coccineum]
MTTLAEFMIIAGADNRPPMSDKSMYDSWKSRMELYIENRENGRMMLSSVQHGPIVWPTIVQEDGLVVPVFTLGDDLIAYLNKAITFMSDVAASRFPSTNNQLRTSSNPINQTTIQDDRNEDLDAYDYNCDDVSTAQAVLMSNISNYGSDVFSEKAQPIKPTLYDGSVISSQHVVIPVIDEEETLILEEMEAAVQQCSVDKQCFEIHKKELFLDNDRLLHQIMSQYILLIVMNSTTVYGDSMNLKMQRSESCDKCFDLNAELLIKQNTYNELMKSYSQHEKHCISLELKMQLNQEIFQKDKSCDNKNALEILEYFENNNLKAQLHDKDTTICKLKEHIKSMRENDKEEKVKQGIDEIETINIELEHSVAKLHFENERLNKEIDHLKQIYKDQFDSIKRIRVCSKEHSESLIAQLNSKSVENADLKAQIHDKVESSKTPDSNKPMLPSTGLKSSTSVSRSQPIGNTKNDRISQTQSSNMKNKVEAQLRRVNLSSNKKNRVKDPICDANVKHTMLNANSELICVKCKQCMFDANHDVRFLEFVNDVNVHSKSKSAKQSQHHNIWKPTGKVFTEIRYKWKPTGEIFTLVCNSCPLTRITSTKVVPLKETTSHSVETQKPKLKVHCKRPKLVKYIGSSKKSKIIESRTANNSEPNHYWGSNATDVPSSSSLVNDKLSRLNDQIAKIMGYGDYQLGNVTIARVYYVEGLHNFFSVGQFCDSDLEVAFQKNTCFIQNLDGVDLLLGSRDTNLYTISLDDMLKTSLICRLSKASKTKSWLWHRRLSYLNFSTLNQLAKDGLARGIPKHKFKNDHFCSACTLGKSKKSSYQPKAKDTNQEKLYLLYMDLCGPICVESITRKKYILVIVDDYP